MFSPQPEPDPEMMNVSSTIGGYANAIISVIGSTLNIFTFLVLVTQKKFRHQPTSIIIMGITLLNILYNGFILSFQSVMYFDKGFFDGAPFVCKLFAFCFYFHYGCVLFIQGVLALSRWIAVCTQHRLTVKKSILACGLACLIPFLILLLPASGLWGNLGRVPATGTCTILDGANGDKSSAYFIRAFFPAFPFTIIIICYILIIKKVKEIRGNVRTPSEVSSTDSGSSYLSKCVSQLTNIRNKNRSDAETTSLSSLPPSTSGISDSEMSTDDSTEVTVLRKEISIIETPKLREKLLRQNVNSLPEYQKKENSDIETSNDESNEGGSPKQSKAKKQPKKKVDKKMKKRKQENDLTLTVGIIFIAYLICNIPVSLILLIDPSAEKYTEAHLPTYILAWLSSCVKPCIYVIFNPAYRQAFIDAQKKVKMILKIN
eukprot:GFUD01002487.1.p1 GENE.GFUD01002487.1~~GFUD01002487.1.p1  ORF type:complete len:481 (-),score=100.37 GFUD01002487.1:359-1651(-)